MTEDTQASLTMLPELLQFGCFEVYAVDLRQDLAHGSINSSPLAGLQRGEGDVAVDMASTVLHQVEGCAKGAGEQGEAVGLRLILLPASPQSHLGLGCCGLWSWAVRPHTGTTNDGHTFNCSAEALRLQGCEHGCADCRLQGCPGCRLAAVMAGDLGASLRAGSQKHHLLIGALSVLSQWEALTTALELPFKDST